MRRLHIGWHAPLAVPYWQRQRRTAAAKAPPDGAPVFHRAHYPAAGPAVPWPAWPRTAAVVQRPYVACNAACWPMAASAHALAAAAYVSAAR